MHTILWVGGGEHTAVLHVFLVQQQLGVDTECRAWAEQAASTAQRLGELPLLEAIPRRYTVAGEPREERTRVPDEAGYRP